MRHGTNCVRRPYGVPPGRDALPRRGVVAVPQAHGTRNGDRQAPAPLADPKSRFTALFEIMVINHAKGVKLSDVDWAVLIALGPDWQGFGRERGSRGRLRGRQLGAPPAAWTRGLAGGGTELPLPTLP